MAHLAAQLATHLSSKLYSIDGLASLFNTKTVEGVAEIAAAAKTSAKSGIDDILAVKENANFDNIARNLDAVRAAFEMEATKLSLVKNTAVEKAVRDAAAAASVELSKFATENFDMNLPLFNQLVQLEKNGCIAELKSSKSADAEALVYFYEESKKDGIRRGLNLDEEGRQKVAALRNTLSELCTKFEQAVNNYKYEMRFTKAELAGVPENVVAGLKTEDADETGTKYIVGLDYPTVFGVLKHCSVARTRAAVFAAFEARAPENKPLLKEILRLRHELALLLGFPSYAALDLDSKMAKTPEEAMVLVSGLVPRLQQKWKKEKEILLANATEGVTLVEGDGGDKLIASSDIMYLMDSYKNKYLNVDETFISEHFAVDDTFQHVLAMLGEFFSVTFTRHTNVGSAFWHESVELLELRDKNKAEGQQSDLRGYIICDLYPRPELGKYGHACCYSAVPGLVCADGTQLPACTVLLCNFSKPVGDKPALFQHSEFVTLLHELGHAMHTLFGKTTMLSQAGTRVKRDFVETQSQSLENFGFCPIQLQRFTHYKTKDPLPPAVIKAKVDSKKFFSGRDMLRQCTFALYALRLHSAFAADPAADTSTLYDEIRRQVLPGIAYTDSLFECSFSHLIGYQASYYGYMYSEVLSDEAFNFVKENCKNGNVCDAAMGQHFVKYLLAPGGSRDPQKIMFEYLSRKPSEDVFLKNLGI